MSEAILLLQELIRNACVNDGTAGSGHEERSVATLRDFLGIAGQVFEPAPGRQSLLYRVAGFDPGAPSLALVPHLDVVPVDPDGWSRDPFAAEIDDGVVYGRGAVDMLNIVAAMAVAVRPYLTGERVPRGDLIFVAVADEEAGGRLGAKALVEERWDLVGADYLLTEVAYPALGGADLPRVPVSVGEKGTYWSTLSAKGTPGHGSAPYGTDNAIAKLARAITNIVATPAPASMDDHWVGFARALGIADDLLDALTDPDRVDGAIDELSAVDPNLARYVHAATHLTISPNVMTGGSKANVIADRARVDLDIRALPGDDRTSVDQHLRKAMGEAADELEISPFMDNPANVSEVGNPLWEAIASGVEEIDGHRRLIPTMMTVATDARFWRARGTVCYGVGLFDGSMSFSEMMGLFHGHDERVSVGSVERTTSLYEKVLQGFLMPQ